MIWNKSFRHSLFYKMFISYLVVILLFAAFNVVAFAFLKHKIESEVIQYNRLILKNTAERYSTHFTRIKNMLFQYAGEENVVGFNRQLHTKTENEIDFLQAKKIILKLRSDISNPLFYLENIVIYFNGQSLTIDKEGSARAEDTFSRLVAGSLYPPGFWKEQFAAGTNFGLLPAASFTPSQNRMERQELIPVTYRQQSSNVQLIALIDVRKTQQAFFGDDDQRRFMILNADNQVLYRSSPELSAAAALDPGRDYELRDGYYYFKERDADGLTYVTLVPYAAVASELRKMNLTLLLIFIVTSVIGLAASIYYSKRIQAPVEQILSSMTERGPLEMNSRITEFTLIHQKIHDLLGERDKVQNELASKKSILTSYTYINKLKSINSDISEWKDFIATDESFVIVLYELHFRAAAMEADMQADRAAYYIREHIDLMISERFTGAHTFQIEHNQILSVISGDVPAERIQALLAELKAVLDQDKAYCLVTIAVSSRYEQVSEFNQAYQQVQELAQRARLLEETQLIYDGGTSAAAAFAFTPSQEHELNTALQTGDEQGSMGFITRCLDELHQKEASVSQFRSFADAVASKVGKILEILRVDPGLVAELGPLGQPLKDCHTLAEYKTAFHPLITAAATLIRAKKEDTDPIVAYVMELLHTKYAEDISLDFLADKLGMSSAYLSVYIKDKTGANFIDHLHEIRIHRARSLLTGTDLSINDISLQSGYRNITSFNRMFKKWTGMTPGEYRKQHWIGARS